MSYFDYPQGSNNGNTDSSKSKEYLMDNLTNSDWKTFFNYTQIVDFEANQTIVGAGRADRSIYVLLKGEGIVVKNHPLLGKHMVAYLEEGQVFGESSFFSNQPRSAAIQATQHGKCLRISYENYLKMLNENPTIANKFIMNIALILSSRNRYANQLFENIF